MRFDIEKFRKDIITKRRIDNKLTLRQVGDETGISCATISRIENRKFFPDVVTFGVLCNWLKTNPSDYFIFK